MTCLKLSNILFYRSLQLLTGMPRNFHDNYHCKRMLCTIHAHNLINIGIELMLISGVVGVEVVGFIRAGNHLAE